MLLHREHHVTTREFEEKRLHVVAPRTGDPQRGAPHGHVGRDQANSLDAGDFGVDGFVHGFCAATPPPAEGAAHGTPCDAPGPSAVAGDHTGLPAALAACRAAVAKSSADAGCVAAVAAPARLLRLRFGIGPIVGVAPSSSSSSSSRSFAMLGSSGFVRESIMPVICDTATSIAFHIWSSLLTVSGVTFPGKFVVRMRSIWPMTESSAGTRQWSL